MTVPIIESTVAIWVVTPQKRITLVAIHQLRKVADHSGRVGGLAEIGDEERVYGMIEQMLKR